MENKDHLFKKAIKKQNENIPGMVFDVILFI